MKTKIALQVFAVLDVGVSAEWKTVATSSGLVGLIRLAWRARACHAAGFRHVRIVSEKLP